jgi:hypothetical protein
MRLIFRMALIAALGAAAIAGSARAADDGVGICIDPAATFDPRAFGGGCTALKAGADRVLFLGRALLEDDYAPDGTAVQALVGNQVCGEAAVEGRFELLVLGAREQPGCAGPGQAVRFTIGESEAQEMFPWPAEQSAAPFHELSLTSVNEHAWYWFERVSSRPPPVGTRIEAFVGETLCGETTLGGEDEAVGFFIPQGIHGFSRLVVPSAEVQPGCATNGSLVQLRVGGLRAETAVVWRAGVHRLNLLVQGDATCDFAVDARDASLVLQHYARLVTSVPCHGDADRDGDLDVFDARHILEFAARITNALPL